MKLLVQRVKKAHVRVEKEVIGEIGQGLLVFLGIHKEDTAEVIPWYVQKLINLRIFPDEEDKMNYSVQDLSQGGILVVSQFTLYGTCSKGRRPEFTQSAPTALARPLYDQFLATLRESSPHLHIESGKFQATMEIELINDGPVTLIIEKPTISFSTDL